MKKLYTSLKTISAGFVFIIFSAGPTKAQWQQTSGPGGGYSTGLFAKGDTLFTGNYASEPYFHIGPPHGTVYRSIDHGVTWQADSTGFNAKVVSFANIGNIVFAATLTDGIFKSSNGGNSWSVIPNSANLSPYVLYAVHGVLFAGSQADGIYRSTDMGATFAHIKNGLPNLSFVQRITSIGNTLFAALTSINGNGIFRSANKGASWQAVNNGFDPGIFEYQFKFGNFTQLGKQLFIAVNDTIRVTTDLGDHWIKANTGISGWADRMVTAGNNLYASVLADRWSMYKSIDRGASWFESGTGYPGSEAAFEIASIGNEVYAGTGYYGSVYRTIDNGATWQAANIGMPESEINAILVTGNAIYSAGLNVPGIHRSIDGGITWQPSGNGLPYSLITTKALAQSDNTLFAGFDLYGVYRSTDNGLSWQIAANGLTTQGKFINALITKSNEIFAGTYDGVFKSNNNGSNWSIASPVINGTRPEIKALISLNGSVFAATPANGIFRSVNDGANWQAVNNGLHTSEIYSFAASGNEIVAGTMKGVYISDNNGNSWTERNNGLPANFNGDRFARTVAMKGNTLFTALFDLSNNASMGIFRSDDNGNHWTKYNDFPDLFAVNCLTINNNTIFAGTETESIWRNDISNNIAVTASAPAAAEIHYTKLSVYPNPAKNLLYVTFQSTNNNENYFLNIADIQGKILIQQSGKTIKGNNYLKIDISHLDAAGYIVRFQSKSNGLSQLIMKN